MPAVDVVGTEARADDDRIVVRAAVDRVRTAALGAVRMTSSPVAPREDVAIGGAGLAAGALGLGLVDELRIFRDPIAVGGGTPLLPPVGEHIPLHLIETRTFSSRVVYERYRRAGGASG